MGLQLVGFSYILEYKLFVDIRDVLCFMFCSFQPVNYHVDLSFFLEFSFWPMHLLGQ